MNFLSNDEILVVFGYLLPSDRRRFTLLSSRIGHLKSSNPKLFPKPTVEMNICSEVSCKWLELHSTFNRRLKLNTSVGQITIEVTSRDMIIIRDDVNARKIMDSFFDCEDPEINCWRNWKADEETVHFNVFAQWLFSVVDVSILEFEKDEELTRMVANAMNTFSCRCFKLAINQFPNEDTMEVLKILHQGQKDMGVNLKIFLQSFEAIKEYAEKTASSQSLFALFGEVYTECDFCNLYHMWLGILSSWWHTNGTMNLRFEKSSPFTSNEFFESFFEIVDYFDLKHTANKEEIDNLNSSRVPEKIRKTWEFRNHDLEGKLNIDILVNGCDVYLSAQIFR